jgi:DNA replication ATP-dependent helicase Dna2
VLVGDHYQLAPLVRNPEALKGGLDVSLFRLLSERHPSALAILKHQYRMNEDIMLLSNSLVYDGLLKCGNEKVARQILRLPNPSQLNFEVVWIRDILSDRYWGLRLSDDRFKVVFCDTDLLAAQETKSGDRTTNDTEASLIKQVRLLSAKLIKDCGCTF